MNKNIIATILLVLAAGIYFTVTEGILEDAKAVQAGNKQYTDAIANARSLNAERDKIRESWKKVSEENREKLMKMIPPSVDNIRLVIDLEDRARKNGVDLRNIKATIEEKPSSKNNPAAAASAMSVQENSTYIPPASVETITVSFDTTAPYLNFRNFMNDLEANLRLMDVTKLGVKASDSGIYDFSVELKTYWLRQ